LNDHNTKSKRHLKRVADALLARILSPHQRIVRRKADRPGGRPVLVDGSKMRFLERVQKARFKKLWEVREDPLAHFGNLQV